MPPPVITRRALLRDASVLVAGVGLAARPVESRAAERPRRLVIARLRGGADGLSMVVPWGDPDYQRLRPGIAVPRPGRGPGAAIDLDGFFGLHPRLAPLVPLFRERLLGIVHACGMPERTTSHLEADQRLDALLRDMGGAPAGSSEVAPASAGDYPSSPFGRALARIARDVKEGAGSRVLVADSWEWDHHAGQRGPDGPLGRRLADLAHGLTALARGLGDHLANTTIVTVTEFGRTAAENRQDGTEHGAGTAMLVIGGGVRRGRVEADWPRLGSRALSETGGLAVTTRVGDVLRALM